MNVDKIMRYEGGEMSEDEEVQFFQELIDSGDAWTLQGHYGRTAMMHINNGMCHKAKVKPRKGKHVDEQKNK